jgi:hypothetical protein
MIVFTLNKLAENLADSAGSTDIATTELDATSLVIRGEQVPGFKTCSPQLFGSLQLRSSCILVRLFVLANLC